MDRQDRANTLKRWAIDVGFDRAGIARPQVSSHARSLLSWLERGDQAEMGYMERRTEVRLDPRTAFPGVASVLCVGMQYHPLQGSTSAQGDLWPRVARYARGSDYHLVMQERLESLARLIEESFPGTTTKVYVDTGPVLERELAAGAGLGAVGKNTNLLDPEGGSWFLLGEIFTSLDLEPDPAVGDLCGSCSACLDACPTGALPDPYRLDSRRCISYWTIEHRGAIPRAIRPLLGDWVFGCDICQEVCPVNENAAVSDHPELLLPAERAQLDLAKLLTLQRADYTEIFRGSAMKRAKLEGLRRNAAVVMGNSGSSRYIPALIEALADDESVVRQHAAWALGQIGDPRAIAALIRARNQESEGEVTSEIEAAIEALLD